MVGRQKARRGRGTGRRTVSRSPAIDDTTFKPTEQVNNAIINHTPLAPPPPPPPATSTSAQAAQQPAPHHSPASSASSKRKFEDIAEISWDSTDDKPLPEVSFSANASIMSVSERPSRRVRSTYTLAASIASIEKTTRTRSRRAITLERSVTRNPLSSGFSKPNDSEKLVVKSRDGRECWLCAQDNTVMLETAHNVVASNRDLFLNYRDTVGIFPPNLRHLASPHNLVTLCRNCHCVYDCQQPRWIILPSNLQFFIDHEIADYESRVKAASEGLVKPRSVPTAIEYAGASATNLYMPYFFEESVMPRMEHEDAAARFPRAYGGAPTTMILKAGLGINQPKIKGSKNSGLAFTTGIPAAVRQQVTSLFELWDRDPPSPKKQTKASVKTCHKEEEHPPASDDENSQNGAKKRKPRANPPGRKRKSPASQSVADDDKDELADICAPTKKKARMMSGDGSIPKDLSPASQGTTTTHTAERSGQSSQSSSATKRYNLRSQYRTPPTSPDITVCVPSTKKTNKRKAGTAATEAGVNKRKRVSTSSGESILAKKSRKIAKATSVKAKKDGKKTTEQQPKLPSPKKEAVTAPLTPKSRPSPNDPISTKRISSVVKTTGVKKQRFQESPIQRSIKRTAASLFGEAAVIASAKKAAALTKEQTEGPKQTKGKEVPRLSQGLPPARFDESLEGEGMADFDSGASNVDSLDAQSGGEEDVLPEEEVDDGYASDSGSERPDKDDWAWGPSHTANDVVEACVGWFGVGTTGQITD